VRTTFKLSEKAIEALNIVSVHLRIKQKSLFDHLLEDAEALSFIAQELHSRNPQPRKRLQKTFVLSRRTLECLETASRSLDTPRDALVEFSIQRLLPLIDKEREKHRKRKRILEELRGYVSQGRELLRRSKRILGQDDPVHENLEAALSALFNAHDQIGSYVEKGKRIEDF
jgi:hypothetical protein